MPSVRTTAGDPSEMICGEPLAVGSLDTYSFQVAGAFYRLYMKGAEEKEVMAQAGNSMSL